MCWFIKSIKKWRHFVCKAAKHPKKQPQPRLKWKKRRIPTRGPFFTWFQLRMRNHSPLQNKSWDIFRISDMQQVSCLGPFRWRVGSVSTLATSTTPPSPTYTPKNDKVTSRINTDETKKSNWRWSPMSFVTAKARRMDIILELSQFYFLWGQ